MEFKYFFKPELITRVSSICYHNMRRGFYQKEHAHASFGHEIIYIDYGSINIKLDGQNISMHSGEILFIKGGCNHSFSGQNRIPFDYLNIMFRGKIPEQLFHHPMTVNRRMRDILQQLKHETEFLEDRFFEMIGSLLTELTVLLIRKLNVPELSISPHLQSNQIHYESEKIEIAMEIIRKNYNTSLQIKDVADAIHISSSYLRMLLRRNTGKNFSTLLHEARIESAKHLIRDEGCNFSEIARKVGFESPSFFFKLFKRHTGMTPKDFAKMLIG